MGWQRQVIVGSKISKKTCKNKRIEIIFLGKGIFIGYIVDEDEFEFDEGEKRQVIERENAPTWRMTSFSASDDSTCR